MAPKRRTTRLNPETTPAATAATTTTVTNAQLQAMIDQGVTAEITSFETLGYELIGVVQRGEGFREMAC
ncbi:hypothetical protein Tco_1295307 [Tanacetum coccineum]